jgi:phosphoribosylformylglycinamidine (FGAM) synthase PurS component
MRFTFTIKTRSGAVMKIEVEAPDQTAAEEKVSPTCTVVKVKRKQPSASPVATKGDF